MRQHDSQLAYHVMLYAIQALSEGDFAAIEDLGFTTDEVQQLSQLPVKALKHLSHLADEMKEVVLSSDDDEFFRKIMFSNFGDVADSIHQLV